MAERPILFSAPMVRAILEGRKTQTRRVVKPPRGHELVELRSHEADPRFSGKHNDPMSWGYPYFDDGAPALLGQWPELCPYGAPGDRLWVRETFCGNCDDSLVYRATVDADTDWNSEEIAETRWRPSIHMPRWASRIDLEVTGVRVERLRDINETDAIAEGIQPFGDGNGYHVDEGRFYYGTASGSYCSLWESINGAGSWNANPWVWVVEFKRVRP